ncbi:MAG: transcriptional activator protein [Gemmatimonadetes bacterium]|nr:transcriptional activator protein [Gemmatimonadota bacterium]
MGRPVIRLRTLGVVEVRHHDGAVLKGLLSQPKRLALLIYLATARPRGFHRRDRLLALFWPELDDERARAALRGSLHFLRVALGADAIIARGDEVAVDAALLTTDVDTLEAALSENRLADVVDAYSGAFLDGLHIKGAAELDQWMDSTRDTLRSRVAAACWTLAEQCVGTSDADAAAWSSRACALTPYDEGAVRRRMQMLHQAGDNAAALRAYTEFSEWLDKEFGAAPSEATRAVADACRVVPVLPPRAVQPSVQQPQAELNVGPAPVAVRSARRRNWPAFIAAAAVLMIVSAITIVYRTSAAPVPAVLVQNRFVVIPFDVEGTGTFGYLREGMVDLLSGTLDGSGALHAVDPHAVLAYAAAQGEHVDATTLGKRMAEKFGAAYFVSGRVLQSGGRANVTAAMSDATGRVITSTQASGDESMLFALVDSLTRQLLAQQVHDSAARLMRLAFSTTASLPALKAYISGIQESRAGRFAEATADFTKAVQLDTTFALALYEQSIAIAWSTGGQDREAVISARKAVARGGLLTLHDRELLRAHMENWSGQSQPAETRLRRILDDYPSDLDAWHELGEVRFHTAADLGHSFVDARSAFEHVLDAPSLAPSARVHLTRIAAYEGDGTATARYARIEARAEPGDARAEEIRLLDAATRSDDRAARATIASLVTADASRIWTNAWSVAQYAGNWRLAEQIALTLTTAERSDDARTSGWLAIAQFRKAAGRPRAADEALANLAAIAPLHATVVRAGFVALPRDTALDLRRAQSAAALLRASTVSDKSVLLRGSAGDVDRTRILVLERLEHPHMTVEKYPRGIAAYPWGPRFSAQPVFPLSAAARFDLGLYATSQRKWAEADHWFSLVNEPEGFDITLRAPAMRARAAAATQHGDLETARRCRARLAWLERDAEPGGAY